MMVRHAGEALGKAASAYEQLKAFAINGQLKPGRRLSASRLYRIASALKTPVAVFFDGLTGPAAALDPKSAPEAIDDVHRLLADPNGRELAQNFPRLNARARAQLGALIRAIAAASGRSPGDPVQHPV